MERTQLKAKLDELYESMDRDAFLRNDPLGIAHAYQKKEDQEIAAFFAAVLAWGRRESIIEHCLALMALMDHSPHAFILGHSSHDLQGFENFVHRTFNGTDAIFFVRALKELYQQGGLEQAFQGSNAKEALIHFHQRFFSFDFSPERSRKHIANPAKGSAAKRLNMFLRWMVRKDGLDLGIWTVLDTSELMCPLDVHVQRSALQLGLLERKQADWKAVEELTHQLRTLDPEDPVKYDLPLFLLSQRKMLDGL